MNWEMVWIFLQSTQAGINIPHLAAHISNVLSELVIDTSIPVWVIKSLLIALTCSYNKIMPLDMILQHGCILSVRPYDTGRFKMLCELHTNLNM
jgi:phosphoribosyl-dephospho-CoA transferase